jgi:DNA-binding winged helix-turn-helix (wHTH) protein
VFATIIVQALAARPGVVKSRNALMDAAYDDQVYFDDRTIESHVKRVRNKFGQVDDTFGMIDTVYGVRCRLKESCSSREGCGRVAICPIRDLFWCHDRSLPG